MVSRSHALAGLHINAEEAGLGHGGVKEPELVGLPHVGQTQSEMVFLDHQSGHRTTHRPRGDLRRMKREVRCGAKFLENLWIVTTLVQDLQCLGLMDLQQRHSVHGRGSFSTGLVSLAG